MENVLETIEIIETIKEIYPDIKEKDLEFIKNPLFYNLINQRANGKKEEMKNLTLASLMNYLDNPLIGFEEYGIYWGSECHALNLELLKQHKITHVL